MILYDNHNSKDKVRLKISINNKSTLKIHQYQQEQSFFSFLSLFEIFIVCDLTFSCSKSTSTFPPSSKLGSITLLPIALNKSSIPEDCFADVYLNIAPISLAKSLPTLSSTSSCSYKSDLLAAIAITNI